MKFIATLLLFGTISSCQNHSTLTDMYIIETRVSVTPNSIEDVLELFKSTNPELVKNETAWVSASFSKVIEEDAVIVRAVWRDKNDYLKFSNSDHFKSTMSAFAPYFTAKPQISISEVLFEM